MTQEKYHDCQEWLDMKNKDEKETRALWWNGRGHPLSEICYKKYYDADIIDGTVLSFYTENYKFGEVFEVCFDKTKEEPITIDNVEYKGISEFTKTLPRVSEDDIDDIDDEPITIKVDNIDYIKWTGVEHLDKMENGETVRMLDGEKIVYPCCSIDIKFTYPINDKVIFSIPANNRYKGFTNKELLEKVLKYFRMIEKIHYHYDIDSGHFSTKVTNDAKLFQCCLGDSLYDICVTGLKYHKGGNCWEVLWNNYC